MAFGLVLLSSTGVFAFSVTHLETEADFLAIISDTLFIAQGRIGDLGGVTMCELQLCESTAVPVATAQYPWTSGAVEPFTIIYNSGTGLITYTLGGKVLTYTMSYLLFGDLFVCTRAAVANCSVIVNDLVLNGQSVGDFASAVGPDTDILRISGAVLANGFTLTGTATLAWICEPPSQSDLMFEIRVAKLAVLGVQDESWGGIKALYR